jgi:phage tail protein X
MVFSALAFLAGIGIIFIVMPGRLPSLSFSINDNHPTTIQVKAHQPPLMAETISGPDGSVPLNQSRASIPMAVRSQSNDERLAAVDKNVPAPSFNKGTPIFATPGAPGPVHEITDPDWQLHKTDGVKPKQPALLGALTVKKNDTLGVMVKIIYGDFHDRILKAVIDANPQIADADSIRVGDTIAFPAIPAPFVQRAYPLWWLKVGNAASLDEAFRQAIKSSENKDVPLTRIITEWAPQNGLKYGIYVSGYFFNPSTAENMLTKLPADFSGSAEIISGWTDQTVLFSDPFLGKGY